MKTKFAVLTVLFCAFCSALAQPTVIAMTDSRVSQIFSNMWGNMSTTFNSPLSDPASLESVVRLYRSSGTNMTETISATNCAPVDWNKWITKFTQYRVEVAVAADPLVLPDPNGVEYEFVQVLLNGQDDKVQSSYILRGNDGSTNILATGSFKYPPPQKGNFFLGTLYGKYVPMIYTPKEDLWSLPIRRNIKLTLDK